MTTQRECVVVCDPVYGERIGSTGEKMYWDVHVGSLVEESYVLGTFDLWDGCTVDVLSPCTGIVTRLEPVAIADQPLCCILPLPEDDARRVARRNAFRAVEQARAQARLAGLEAPEPMRWLCSPIALAMLIERCARDADPVLAESTLLAQAVVDAQPAAFAAGNETILLCDAGAATRWLRFRVEAGRVAVSHDAEVLDELGGVGATRVVARVRAPGPTRASDDELRRLVTIGAEDDTPEQRAWVCCEHSKGFVDALASILRRPR